MKEVGALALREPTYAALDWEPRGEEALVLSSVLLGRACHAELGAGGRGSTSWL